MPRFFTLQQAEQMLPQVESMIRRAISIKSDYQEAEAEQHGVARRITMLGGVLVDHTRLRDQKNQRDSLARALQEAIEKIHEYGCLVKDLDIGLVDFPTQFHGEEVYLCWKLGESGIQFWHAVKDGFRGRKPIDQDFLQHHCGELPN
jgi:hypothetical protein